MDTPDDWLVCDDEDAACSLEAVCFAARLFSIALCRATAANVWTTSREPASEPVEDCELALRDMTGLRFEAAVAATIFLIGATLLSPFADRTAGGRIPDRDCVAACRVGAAEEVAADCSRFADGGGGGGGIIAAGAAPGIFGGGSCSGTSAEATSF